MPYEQEIYNIVKNKILIKKCECELEAYNKQQYFFNKNSKAKKINDEILNLSSKLIRKILNTKQEDDEKNEVIKNIKFEKENLKKKLAKILEDNNLPSDYLSVEYHCKICNDNGKLDGGLFCSCFKEKLKREALKHFERQSMLSSEILNKISFESFCLDFYSNDTLHDGYTEFLIMKNVLTESINYAEKFSLSSSNLLLVGKTGLGKTHLSIAIAKYIIKNEFNVMYTSAPNLVKILSEKNFNKRNSFEWDSFSTENSPIVKSDLFIIDDLGTEFNSKFLSSLIYNIINIRILKSLPMIINTNLSINEIENNYKPSLASRIIGHFKRLAFVGKDIRQQKNNF